MPHYSLILLICIAFNASLVYADISNSNNFTNETNESVNKESPIIPFRLPSSVIPKHYKLQVLHLLDEVTISVQNTSLGYKRFTAPGKVWITVDVVQPTENITLHAEELEIIEVKVSLNNHSTHEHKPSFYCGN